MPEREPHSTPDATHQEAGTTGAMLSALDTMRNDCAAELRYRRLVAWIACLLVGLLLVGAVVGGYVHRDRVAALERDLAAARAVADERADAIRDLRAELAREHQRRADDVDHGE